MRSRCYSDRETAWPVLQLFGWRCPGQGRCAYDRASVGRAVFLSCGPCPFCMCEMQCPAALGVHTTSSAGLGLHPGWRGGGGWHRLRRVKGIDNTAGCSGSQRAIVSTVGTASDRLLGAPHPSWEGLSSLLQMVTWVKET